MKVTEAVPRHGALGRMALACAAGALLWCAGASAQIASPSPDVQNSWNRKHLLGDMGGLRPWLKRHGMKLDLTDEENLLGNVSGGVKRGFTLQGVLTAGLTLRTQQAFGWSGGKFHVSALQIHGASLSDTYLDNLQQANGDEAENATRLWELWYDQALPGTSADVRVGQQSIDNEFIVSENSELFVNTMAGWPLVPSLDLYGGGPAYPLSTLGVRLRAKLPHRTRVLVGVFDDDPGGGAFGRDAQKLDASGTSFNLDHGALVIAEVQHRIRFAGLQGSYKFGGWYDTAEFPDQRFAVNGLPLAASGSGADPRMHRGNYSLYAVADQTVWRANDGGGRRLNAFGRIMGAPADRNAVDFFFNGGLTLKAPLPGRPHDHAGIDFGIGRVSARLAGFDRDSGLPVQTTEELVELTYQAQVMRWFTVQPDLQYVIHPGAGVLDPADPTHGLRNELVLGARATVEF